MCDCARARSQLTIATTKPRGCWRHRLGARSRAGAEPGGLPFPRRSGSRGVAQAEVHFGRARFDVAARPSRTVSVGLVREGRGDVRSSRRRCASSATTSGTRAPSRGLPGRRSAGTSRRRRRRNGCGGRSSAVGDSGGEEVKASANAADSQERDHVVPPTSTSGPGPRPLCDAHARSPFTSGAGPGEARERTEQPMDISLSHQGEPVGLVRERLEVAPRAEHLPAASTTTRGPPALVAAEDDVGSSVHMSMRKITNARASGRFSGRRAIRRRSRPLRAGSSASRLLH